MAAKKKSKSAKKGTKSKSKANQRGNTSAVNISSYLPLSFIRNKIKKI